MQEIGGVGVERDCVGRGSSHGSVLTVCGVCETGGGLLVVIGFVR